MVTDKAPLEGIYSKEGFETNDKKYKRLLSLLYLPPDFFYERKVFSNLIEEGKIRSVEFSSFRNPKFQLNYEQFLSSPLAPKGISMDTRKMKEMLKNISKIEAEKVYSYKDKQNVLKDIKGRMTLYYKDGHYIYFDIYSSFKGHLGIFVKRDNQIFKLKKKDRPLLFASLQDFWIKKLPLSNQIQELSFFVNAKKKLSMNINQASVKESINKSKRGLSEILKFFDKEADKVSIIDYDIKKILKTNENQNLIKFFLNEGPFSMIFGNNETMIVDQNKNYVLHFYGENSKSLEYFLNEYGN